MKRPSVLILLIPALAAASLSIVSYYYSWKFHALYVAQAENHKRAEEKIASMQCLAPRDVKYLVSLIDSNHKRLQDDADMFSAYGLSLAGLALGTVFFVYRTSKRRRHEDVEGQGCKS